MEAKNMNLKRVLTSVVGLPLVVLVMTLGTPQVINFVIMVVAIICMDEYFNVIQKICKPIRWVGYASTLVIFLLSILSVEIIEKIIIFEVSVILLILFLHIIITDMKITFKDVSYTFLGIMYITGFTMFLGLITIDQHGKIILGYAVLIAWITDIFAYVAGKTFGKHNFSKISPKKTIEGCIVGTVFAVIIGIIYATILNANGALEIKGISYLYVGIVSLILSVVSQIGDFTASSIKRFADTKDYGTMLPGHGGMLDRVDSLIFIAPFVYMIISFM